MTSSIGKTYSRDYLLVDYRVANSEIDKNILAPLERLKSCVNHLTATSIDRRRIKMLCNRGDYITKVALNYGLYFRIVKPVAVISGAGIAGLAASFELRARGFNVVITEIRQNFSRFNVINLNVETQVFLKKFNLLKKFEKSVASRINEHRYVFVGKSNTIRRLPVSDVSKLRLNPSLSFEPKNFNKLFVQDGIYSVTIGMLQTFLAENALEMGVNIFGNETTGILSRTKEGGVSKVQITVDRILQPDLFFIAEGAHSSTAFQIGMKEKKVINSCTDENWIFGNMSYSGKETFVVSLIDASEKTLRIANVIFNANSNLINIAVTSDKEVSEAGIREQILRTAHQVFAQESFLFEATHSELRTTVSKTVHVTNRTLFPVSMGNVFCIGDSAGSSSPLAGLGGTLGLTLVPLAVRQLLDDYEKQSRDIHERFNEFSEAYTSRWIEKSEKIKEFCISMFVKEQASL